MPHILLDVMIKKYFVLSLNRDLGKVGERDEIKYEWPGDYHSLCLRPLRDEIKYVLDKDYDSFQVTHNASPVIPINYWRKCVEIVW